MRHARRRYIHSPPDLTSLFDVLMLLIFAALIRTAMLMQEASAKTAQPEPQSLLPIPMVALDASALRTRALADLEKQLAARPIVVARVASTGTLATIEIGDKLTQLDTPLLEKSPDPDIGVAYLGDRSADQRVCRLIALHVRTPDLAPFIVIIAPDKRFADLPHALYEGLRRDVDRCLLEQKGLAVLVDPIPVATPTPGGTP